MFAIIEVHTNLLILGLSCYKHDLCSTKKTCVTESSKIKCLDTETFCFVRQKIYLFNSNFDN